MWHHVGIAEQIVQVAERLLVGATRKAASNSPRRNESCSSSVRLVSRRLTNGRCGHRNHSYVSQDPVAYRALVQAVDRHDRKHLLDRPAVRERLEQREIAEVDVGQHVFQTLELSGIWLSLRQPSRMPRRWPSRAAPPARDAPR